MNPLTSNSVIAVLSGATLDHMEETRPERQRSNRGRVRSDVGGKSKSNICHRSLDVPSGVQPKDPKIIFPFYADILKYIKKGRHSIYSYKSPHYCQNFKTDTGIVDTAYSSLRLYPKVGKTMMKYHACPLNAPVLYETRSLMQVY